MIGWCMILMAVLVHLGVAANAIVGIAIIALHNVTNFFPEFMEKLGQGSAGWFWKILYLGGGFGIGERGPPLLVLFVLVPWVGVMMAGYAFGSVMQMPPERRRVIELWLGLGAIAGFLILRALDRYGDPRHWNNALGFLNTSKYPASLLFLLMTLGPMFIGLRLAENARGRTARALATFGRVPLFYYLLHIPVIHAAACIVSWIREGAVNPWLFTNHPMAPGPVPDGYTWSLPLLYLVFALVIAVLYFPCRWFAELKSRRREVWLSYF
jgi:uncharacterized membrane protein